MKVKTKHVPVRFLSSLTKESNRMPIDRIEAILMHCYSSKAQWGLYLDKYLDLFCKRNDAELKARTHSIVLACRNLRINHGCSFDCLYKTVRNRVQMDQLDIETTILNLENKFEFIDSIFSL